MRPVHKLLQQGRQPFFQFRIHEVARGVKCRRKRVGKKFRLIQQMQVQIDADLAQMVLTARCSHPASRSDDGGRLS